jgi:lipoic acid synthetase
MVGLGETPEELNEAMDDLRLAQVDVLTFGQYLRPSLNHLPVEKYYEPQEFEGLKRLGQEKQFLYVASGAMVRSSYKAAELFMEGVIRSQKTKGEQYGTQIT